MRIYFSPFVILCVILDDQMFSDRVGHRHAPTGTFSHLRGSFEQAYFFHITVLLMPSRPIKYPLLSMLRECCAVMAARRERWSRLPHSIART
jgi:hypothetical protein